MAHQERRHYPRVQDERLSLTLATGAYDTVAHTLNISASGVYCKLSNEIPIMSRVNLALMIPEAHAAGKPRTIKATGVVVREHPVIIDGKVRHYDTAIFFEDVSQKDRETIERYIAHKRT